MSGISIRVATASFTHAVASLTLPDLDHLVGEYVFGVDEASTVKNRANPDAPMTVVGTPSYASNGAGVSGGGFGSNGFDTGLAPQGDVTMMVIASLSSGTGIFFGSRNDPTTIFGFELGGGQTQYFNNQWSAPPNNPQVALTGGYAFYAGVGPLGQPGKVYKVTGGGSPTIVSATGTAAGGGRTSTTIKYGTGQTGTGNVIYANIYEDRLLTQAEIVAAYQSVRSYLSPIATIA